MMDITHISRELAGKAQSVAEHLLPGGRREGHEWRCGSVAGEAGQSLGVHLSGPKAGTWKDFSADDKGGDLLDLWAACRGIKLSEALQEAREWLGITRPEPFRNPRPVYSRPEKPKCVKAQGKVLDYLREDRNISMEAINAYKVAAQDDRIIFPFLLPDGALALAKARPAVDGGKPVPTAANCEPVLFGWQVVPDDCREITIVEGEIDALSLWDYGKVALSVPFGGGSGAKQQWIENDWERLERFERINIATDNDEQGEAAAVEIATRLGRHRCYRVRLPRKDANQCLFDGVSREEIEACFAKAEGIEPEGLKKAGSFAQAVEELFYPTRGEEVGYTMPYGKIGDKLRFRPGEVTLWTGASGSGKSQILSDCSCHWIHEGSRLCVASLEMKPAQLLKRKVKQAGCVDRPTREFLQAIIEWLDHGLLIYERVGKAGVKNLLEVFDYARARYGCDQFVIDSLMRLGVPSDDYVGQEKAMFEIVQWAIDNNVHLHLVAHARKSEKGNTGAPETDDVKGAMEIGANAFNIVGIWRNRKQEEANQKAEESGDQAEEAPSVILNVAKQRNGDFEGKCGLWFDQSTYRYTSSFERGHPRKYVSLRKDEAA